MLWERTTEVTSCYADRTSRMGLRQLAMLSQDAVTGLLHTMRCGGVRVKAEYGALWMFSRAVYLLHTPPNWMDPITVRCGFERIGLAAAVAGISVTDPTGALLAEARIELMPVDEKTRRLKRLRDVGFPAETECVTVGSAGGFSAVPPLSETEAVLSRQVLWEETDMNGHANNLFYVSLALSAAEEPAGETAFHRLDVGYLKECLAGSTVNAVRERRDRETVVALFSGGICAVKALLS